MASSCSYSRHNPQFRCVEKLKTYSDYSVSFEVYCSCLLGSYSSRLLCKIRPKSHRTCEVFQYSRRNLEGAIALQLSCSNLLDTEHTGYVSIFASTNTETYGTFKLAYSHSFDVVGPGKILYLSLVNRWQDDGPYNGSKQVPLWAGFG